MARGSGFCSAALQGGIFCVKHMRSRKRPHTFDRLNGRTPWVNLKRIVSRTPMPNTVYCIDNWLNYMASSFAKETPCPIEETF